MRFPQGRARGIGRTAFAPSTHILPIRPTFLHHIEVTEDLPVDTPFIVDQQLGASPSADLERQLQCQTRKPQRETAFP